LREDRAPTTGTHIARSGEGCGAGADARWVALAPVRVLMFVYEVERLFPGTEWRTASKASASASFLVL